jgi:hypothetical protein
MYKITLIDKYCKNNLRFYVQMLIFLHNAVCNVNKPNTIYFFNACNKTMVIISFAGYRSCAAICKVQIP